MIRLWLITLISVFSLREMRGLTRVTMELPLTIQGSEEDEDSYFTCLDRDSTSGEIYLGGYTEISELGGFGMLFVKYSEELLQI